MDVSSVDTSQDFDHASPPPSASHSSLMREPASLNPLGVSRAIRTRLVNFNERMRIVRSHGEGLDSDDEELDPKLVEWLEAQEEEFQLIRTLEAQERKKDQVGLAPFTPTLHTSQRHKPSS